MTNMLTINGHKIIKTKINETDFRISVARAQKFIFSFVLSPNEGAIPYKKTIDIKKSPRGPYIIANWIDPILGKIYQWTQTEEIPEEAEESNLKQESHSN